MALAFGAAAVLFGARLAFSLNNQPPPTSAPWFAELPRDSRIADFSWDFYEAARRDGRPVMRSLPLIEDAQVAAWVRRMRPDFIVSAIDPQSTWILVFHPEAVFAASGYCVLGDVDWSGTPVAGTAARKPPGPLFWKLGMFRDHGPYRIHVPCERAPGPRE